MSIEKILKNNLCTGCGACISEDKSKTAKMVFNESQFLVPNLTELSTQDTMYNVCPFNDKNLNEDELGAILFKSNVNAYNEKIGYYNGLYAGYSKNFRETSSSGGMATYIFEKLLSKKIVEHLFVVKESDHGFEYMLCNNIYDITKISKTRYMPVTLENLFTEIAKVEGRVAISGVACFVKAVRLKQEKYPELKEKIPFVVGIICGGLKSKYYTDFLAKSSGCDDDYKNIQYRVKKPKSFALDYKFQCESKNTKKIHMVDMLSLGDMWGTGLFKSNACDFCDDVMTELADISLGDAWISPYDKLGLGNSIVVTRSKLAGDIINAGIFNKNLVLNSLNVEEIIKSQSGSFNHRHKGLYYRLDIAKKNNNYVLQKRKRFIKKQNFLFNIVQSQRLRTREKSLAYWQETKNVEAFNKLMFPLVNRLKLYTKIYHRTFKIFDLFKKILGVK